jgi:hypothetical protein
LGTGKFGSSNNDTVTLQGFRATADIDKAGGMLMGTLRARIYGVDESSMHSITTLAMQAARYSEIKWQPNTVDAFAIDGEIETLVFSGNIVNAWADYQNMPDVHLHIQAQAAFKNAIAPSTPKSFKGEVDVATIMGTLAKEMGYVFENNDVNVKLSNVYLANTALEQARDLAKAAGIVMVIDDKVLAICQTNGSRKSSQVPLVSKDSGLVGYPTLDAAGVTFTALFNPAIRFMHQFELKSDQVRASGVWVATCISYRLESEKPGGSWFMVTRGNFQGTPYVGR